MKAPHPDERAIRAALRRANLDDMAAVAKIHRLAFFHAMPHMPVLHTPEEDSAYYSTVVFPGAEIWLSEQDGIAAGFIAFRPGWVDHLYVHPDFQGRGIGSVLLELARVSAESLRLWTFQGNLGARRFYERHGFQVEEETDGTHNEERQPDVRYVWKPRAPDDASAMLAYYSRRAAEYERIYHKPERQADLALLREHLRTLLADRRVLEVACGTGYWTAAIADVAAALVATDASEEVLDVARAKGLGSRVTFRRADAWRAGELSGDFDAGFAAFWWSHVPRQRRTEFLTGFHAALKAGARVVFADNRFVAGSSTPISRTDEAGNTCQLRRLDDGSTHEVMKNFPTRAELLTLAEEHGCNAEVVEWDYFWCLSYELPLQ